MRVLPSPVVVLMAALAVGAPSLQDVAAPVSVRIPDPPIPVVGSDGRRHLAYEIHVANLYRQTGPLTLERVEAFGEAGDDPLVTYAGEDLRSRVMHAGAPEGERYGPIIQGGMTGIVYVWVSLDAGRRIGAALRHRLVFVAADGTRSSAGEARVTVRSSEPIVLAPPFPGGIWFVHNGPGQHRSAHWGSVLARDGRLGLPQRYAVDFIGLDEEGRAVRSAFNTSANSDWVGFGADVLSTTGGVVRAVRDGSPDNMPMAEVPPPADVTAADTYGNYAIVEAAPHTFVHYAHLQRGSVAVKAGQRVRQGQVLGRLGNSGNTNAPHLHFNVASSARPEESEGLPYVFARFDRLGETTPERAIAGESSAAFVAPSTAHRHQLPLNGTAIRFPQR